MTQFSELYSSDFENSGTIATTASVIFGGDTDTIHKRSRYGSANSLIITSRASETFLVELDGIRKIGNLQPNGSLIIKPEDGIYYDTVKLTNKSGSTTSANEISCKIAKSNVIFA